VCYLLCAIDLRHQLTTQTMVSANYSKDFGSMKWGSRGHVARQQFQAVDVSSRP
jgi:hypothetical protein